MASLALFPASPLASAPPAGLLASLSRRFGRGRRFSWPGRTPPSPSAPDSAGERSAAAEPSSGGLLGTLQLGALFGPWYLFNIYFNIYNTQLVAILPLAMVHTLGNLFANRGLEKVAVSFTHTIKAKKPFFSVLHSSIFLGEGWILECDGFQPDLPILQCS